MNWSWKLGKLAGIDIFVHWTFLLLPAAILVMTVGAGGSVSAALASIVFVLLIFGCVVLHELGHALMARHFGIGTRDITLLPIGGVAQLERMPKKPSQEIAVALAGPAVNVVIAAALFAGLMVTSAAAAFTPWNFAPSSLVAQLMLANVALVVFNMLPAFPMDGGRVLRAILATRMPYVRATQIAARVGQVLAVAMGILGLFVGWTLTLVAMFIYFAARGEADTTRRTAMADRANVGRLMRQRFRILPAEARLRDVESVLSQRAQSDFPVVHGRRLVGMVSAAELAQRIAIGQDQIHVADVMQTDVPALVEHQSLDSAVAQMQAAGMRALPVVRAGELVGLVSLASFGEAYDDQLREKETLSASRAPCAACEPSSAA